MNNPRAALVTGLVALLCIGSGQAQADIASDISGIVTKLNTVATTVTTLDTRTLNMQAQNTTISGYLDGVFPAAPGGPLATINDIHTAVGSLSDPDLQAAFGIIADDGGGFITNIDDVLDDTADLAQALDDANLLVAQLEASGVLTEVQNGINGLEALLNFSRAQWQAAAANSSNHPSNLPGFVLALEGLINALKGDIGPDVDLDVVIELMSILPAQGQAIIGQALVLAGIDDAFIDRLTQAALAVPDLVQTVEATSTIDPVSCSALEGQRDFIDSRVSLVSLTGLGLELTGSVISVLGGFSPTNATPKIDAGVAALGYASYEIEADVQGGIAELFSSTGSAMISLAGVVAEKTDACDRLAMHDSLHQRFVDVVGDGDWEPGQPLVRAHTLAGIGDGVVGANSALASINNDTILVPAVKSNTDLIPGIGNTVDSIFALNTSIKSDTDQTLAAIPDIFNQLDDVQVNTDLIPGIGGQVDAIQVNTDMIPGIGSQVDGIFGQTTTILSNTNLTLAAIPDLTGQLGAIQSTVDSNKAVLAYVADRINSIPSLKRMPPIPVTVDPDPGTSNPSTGTKTTGKGKSAVVAGASIQGDPNKLMLRIRIEESLMDAEDTRGLAILYRPKALGGHLEFVREIVKDTIQLNLAGGYVVGTAMNSLEEGDAQLASGYYKEAWLAYGEAYRKAL